MKRHCYAKVWATEVVHIFTSSYERIYSCFYLACPGEFSCYPPNSQQQKCISNDDVCNGVIDCDNNYVDEINCNSGCFYDPNYDDFHQYYGRFKQVGITVPPTLDTNGSIIVSDPMVSWRNDSNESLQTIRFNKVIGGMTRSCRWTIKPAQVNN